jgi:hypothetical protein
LLQGAPRTKCNRRRIGVALQLDDAPAAQEFLDHELRAFQVFEGARLGKFGDSSKKVCDLASMRNLYGGWTDALRTIDQSVAVADEEVKGI